MNKDRKFFKWAEKEYPGARAHIIRLAPDAAGPTPSWLRFVFARSLMIVFFYKRASFPATGSKTYMFYPENSALIPKSRAAIGILNTGAKFDSDEDRLPNWAPFCDPAFLVFKSLAKEGDDQQPFRLCHLDRCATMNEIYGPKFTCHTRLVWPKK